MLTAINYPIVLILGQQDDARMNLAIALTATRHGATVANHVTVTKLHKTDGKLSGARLRVCTLLTFSKCMCFLIYQHDIRQCIT